MIEVYSNRHTDSGIDLSLYLLAMLGVFFIIYRSLAYDFRLGQ